MGCSDCQRIDECRAINNKASVYECLLDDMGSSLSESGLNYDDDMMESMMESFDAYAYDESKPLNYDIMHKLNDEFDILPDKNGFGCHYGQDFVLASCPNSCFLIQFCLDKTSGKMWCVPCIRHEVFRRGDETEEYNATIDFCNNFGIKTGVKMGIQANKYLKDYGVYDWLRCKFDRDEDNEEELSDEEYMECIE